MVERRVGLFLSTVKRSGDEAFAGDGERFARGAAGRRNPVSRAAVRTAMSYLEAIRLALAQIRAQKLKSFFTLLGVAIGVTFLIAVVSIVDGMGKYMEDDLVGKIIT